MTESISLMQTKALTTSSSSASSRFGKREGGNKRMAAEAGEEKKKTRRARIENRDGVFVFPVDTISGVNNE